jgi:arsenite methyltransferase
MNITIAEFNDVRSSYYQEAMIELPHARDEEATTALQFLKPRKGEKILEVGAGGGFFSVQIAAAIKPGILTATDPSSYQLEALTAFQKENIEVIQAGADTPFLDLELNSYDAIWSGGSFHHVKNKTQAFQNFFKFLKNGGRLVISDVFTGSDLAKHFDLEVAKYCVTGHEVSFLSEEFADSLCFLAGFQKPQFTKRTIQWQFSSKENLGLFLYKIHAMVKTTPQNCYKKAESILGIEHKNGLYCLNWPLTILMTQKA